MTQLVTDQHNLLRPDAFTTDAGEAIAENFTELGTRVRGWKSGEFDYDTAGTHTILTVPEGFQFIVDVFEAVVTAHEGEPGTWPSVRFGVSGNTNLFVSDTPIGPHGPGERSIFNMPTGIIAGGTSIVGRVQEAASATVTGYFVVRGRLISEESA